MTEPSLNLGNGNWAGKSGNLLAYHKSNNNFYADDLTFARASTGTIVNADGLIEEMPWNLITYSEDFSNSSYIKDSGITIGTTNNVSPISNNTATQINVTNSGRIYKNVTSAEYRTSVYLKAGTFAYFKVVGQNVDLNLGTISSVYPADIEDVGNGWYRISISYITSIRPFQIQAFPDNTYSTHTTSGNYFIWGAMLNYGDTTKPYIKTTDRLNVPRVDYLNNSNGSLILEPQRTNIATYSSELDNAAWTKSGTTITANNTTSPDGTTNADKIIASSGLSIKIAYQVISSTNSVAHTVSAFYKADEYSYAFLRVGGQTPSPYVIYNLLNQSVVSTANATSTKIEDYGSGWYRVSMTYTANSATNAPNIAFLPTSGYTLDSANQPSYSGDGSSGGYVYGVQLEANASYPTTLINTTGTTVTRLADTSATTGLSDVIGQTQGTLYSEFDLTEDVNSTLVEINLGNSTNNRILAYRSLSYIQFVVQVGGVIQINNATLVNFANTNKIAVTYQTNDFKIYLNGSLVKTYVSGNIPSGFNTIPLQDNFLQGRKQGIKSLAIFKEILTSTELETLTTL